MAENVIPMIPDDVFKCTGASGELPHGSTNVWAKAIFAAPKVHFWRHQGDWYQSLCKSAEVPTHLHNGQCSLFAPGSYPKCKRCMNLLRKGGSS